MPTCAVCHSEVPPPSRFCASCGTPVASARPASRSHALDDPTQEYSPTGAPTILKSGAAGYLPGSHPTQSGVSAAREALFAPGVVLAGRYRIISRAGKGGMGEVYRADDLTLGQPVALKFLPAELAESPRWMERFRNEVRTARQVAHPNVCRVHDLGEVPSPEGAGGADGGGAPLQFLTMEFIDGEDLASLLRRIGRLPRDKAVQVAHQLCAGLAAAHAAGVLHRDLKPANVMIDGRGNAKITDFGIAELAGRIEGSEVKSGTPAYMSPEQLAGQEVTIRSDIYSLGLVLYELFTGRRAFLADTVSSATASRTAAEVSRPSTIVQDMDPVIERVIMRCLNEDPAQRPMNAMSVAVALPGGDPLRAALEAGETPSPELVAAAGSVQNVRTRKAAALLAGSVACIVLCFVVSRWTGLVSYLPLPRSPEVLADRARDVVSKLGAGLEAADWSGDFLLQPGVLGRIANASDEPDRWEVLRTGRPAALRYWYRTSPANMVPWNIGRQTSQRDPPLDTPGMTLVELDSLGRLTSFEAVPPWTERANRGGPRGSGAMGIAEPFAAARTGRKPAAFEDKDAASDSEETDWTTAFELAELKIAEFNTVAPTHVPSQFSDTRFAWEAIAAEGSTAGLRVEAASYEGRPTLFRVVRGAGAGGGPGGGAGSGAAGGPPQGPTPIGRVIMSVVQAIIILGVLVSVWLARRNDRAGRGDRSGAARLASGFFVLGLASWALSTHFVPDMMTTWSGLLTGSSRSLIYGALAWVFYLALEPEVRRRAPQLIVSWTRLIAGRVRDPLVGRDALIGSLLGAAFALLVRALPLAHQAVTGVMPQPTLPTPRVLSGVLGASASLTDTVVTASINAMLVFFLYITLSSRLKWHIGTVIFALLVSANFIIEPSGGSKFVVGAGALLIGVGFTLMFRLFALFSSVVAIFVGASLTGAPMTTDIGSWHMRGSAVVLLAVATLLAWAYTSATGVGRGARAPLAN